MLQNRRRSIKRGGGPLNDPGCHICQQETNAYILKMKPITANLSAQVTVLLENSGLFYRGEDLLTVFSQVT